MIRYEDDVTALVDAVLSGQGETRSELRRAVEARAAALSGGQGSESRSSELQGADARAPDALSGWVEKVARHAYRTTDDDIESLKTAGYSEDQIFEVTIAAALGASRARLERALGTLRREEGGAP